MNKKNLKWIIAAIVLLSLFGMKKEAIVCNDQFCWGEVNGLDAGCTSNEPTTFQEAISSLEDAYGFPCVNYSVTYPGCNYGHISDYPYQVGGAVILLTTDTYDDGIIIQDTPYFFYGVNHSNCSSFLEHIYVKNFNDSGQYLNTSTYLGRFLLHPDPPLTNNLFCNQQDNLIINTLDQQNFDKYFQAHISCLADQPSQTWFDSVPVWVWIMIALMFFMIMMRWN